MSQNNAVVQAILAATQNPQIQAAMLLGSRMESSWSTTSVGDNGTSFGPFQIHLPAHPGVSQAEAEDPTWAVHYMLPAYTAGVSQVPASLWGTNPALAAATAAYHAERPAKMYSSSAYSADWNNYVLPALGGNSAAVASGGGGANTAAATASSGLFDFATLNPGLNDMYMGGLMMMGLALIGVGAVLVFKDAFVRTGAAQDIKVTVKGAGSGGQSNSGGGTWKSKHGRPPKEKSVATSQRARPPREGTPPKQSPSEPESRRSTVKPVRVSPKRPTRATATRVKPAPRVVNTPKEIAS